MKFIDRDRVLACLAPAALMESMEAAFRDHAARVLPPPERLDSYLPTGEFHVKAGHAQGVFVVKANSAYFDNPPTLPAIQGLIVAYDSTNGTPVAVIHSGSVTALRTAAATAVAARTLARPDASSMALIGAGAQGWAHARALRDLFPIQAVHVWSRSRDTAEALAFRLRDELSVRAVVADSAAEAAAAADLIVTCTPSTGPLLDVGDLRPGSFLAAVGADSPHKQELSARLTASVSLFTDLTGQCLVAGELHHAVTARLMQEQDVRAELGQVLIGASPGRVTADEIVVYDSTGTGFQDAAAAAAVLAADSGGASSP